MIQRKSERRLSPFSRSPFSRLPCIPVLAYHQIDIGFEVGVNSISPRAFEHQVRFIAEQGYTTITLDTLIHILSFHEISAGLESQGHSTSCADLPQRPILLTFDDGYENFYTYAYPILKKYGLTATVFILVGYIGQLNRWDIKLRLKRPRHLSRAQIQTLSTAGIGFGSHGMSHRFLAHCSKTEAEIELQQSRALLEEILQQSVCSFAYPYGNASLEIAKMAQSAGYQIAFGLNPSQDLQIGLNYRFPRMAIYRCDTFRAFQAKLGLLGERRFAMECAKNRWINRFAYLNLLRRA